MQVALQLHSREGHEADPIPGHECVRLQFTPNHPKRLTAGCFSARYKIVRKVQTRCLRKEHEDGHWVATLAKYNKIRLVRVRDALAEIGAAHSVVRLGLDDQKQMPVGLPGLPVNSGARPHGPVAAPVDQQLDAADHDSTRQGTVANSLIFDQDIPEHPGDSWYGGTPIVILHCGTFEKSDAFFHAAQVLHQLRTKEAAATAAATATGGARAPPNWGDAMGMGKSLLLLSLQTDGGADHRNTLLKVKLSLLALKRCLNIRRLDSERCAPSASATLVHERVFSLLNLGLQHTSFARTRMDDDLEAMVRSLSSMAEIRYAAGVGPPPKHKGEAAATEATSKNATGDDDEEEGEGEGEEDDDRSAGEGYEVREIIAERFRRAVGKEYLVRWAPPYDEEEPSWQPAANLEGAPKIVEAWRRSRLSEEEMKAEDLAAVASAAKEAEAKAAAQEAKAAAEEVKAAAEEAKVAKRRRLREQFKGAIYKVIALVKERLILLELKGKRVVCPEVAPAEVTAELHASLRELDDAYDPKYNLMSQLKNMPILEMCLTDPKHTFDSTYMLSMQDCEEENCTFGCCGWADIPSNLKALLRCKPVLPMLDPNNPGHMYSYDQAATLPGGTSECELPSKKDLTPAEEKARTERDKGKELHPSKVREIVCCNNCGRYRVIFAKNKPTEKLRNELYGYLECVNYSCGDALFPAESIEGVDKELAEIFYVAEALTCRDDMQLHYFNYGGLRGRDEFQHVCARCGNTGI